MYRTMFHVLPNPKSTYLPTDPPTYLSASLKFRLKTMVNTGPDPPLQYVDWDLTASTLAAGKL